MKDARLLLRAAILLLTVSLSVGCASITPIKSKPPYSKIVLNEPFSWGDGILTLKINMPAGTYTPTFEDDEGYFYQAPQKITGRDTFYPLIMDGGLYLKRGLTKPDMLYCIRGQTNVPAKVNIGDRAKVTMIK